MVDETKDEGDLSHLDVTGMKIECMDQSYDIKSEIKVEDTTPVPISYPVVKTEVDEDFLDVARVQQEQTVTLPSEEDEVLTESFVDHDEKRVIRERIGIDREEDNLTECGSNRADCSNISDRMFRKCSCSQVVKAMEDRNERRWFESRHRQVMSGGPPARGLGEGLTTHHRKKQLVSKPSNKTFGEAET
ncbi:hypothetical protein ANN_27992 [Periplaneta americana]|uniref:Uncharacterized protein n=1 Tax=Periplaneta americana TaxID=6978 RepID=A0ABQ8RUN9_PERAM|nr:hypothetical protein ANN_27992 [Periplaneta americana]